MCIGPSMNIDNGEWEHIHRLATVKHLKSLVRRRRVHYIHFGTPCTFWSIATDNRSIHETIGRQALRITIQLIHLCNLYGVFFSLENPLSSALWKQPGFIKTSRRFGEIVDLDYCRFGAHYKKPTRFYTNIPNASSLALRCCGGHIHDYLQGTAVVRGKARWKTALASAYPPALARAVALLVRDAIIASEASRGRLWQKAGPSEIVSRQRQCLLEMCRATGAAIGEGCEVPSVPANRCRAWPANAKTWGGGRAFVARRSDGQS